MVAAIVPARAEDTALIATSGGGRARLSGRVVDFTGRELLVELPGGRQQTAPGRAVVSIDTSRNPRHEQADAAFAVGDFSQAVGLYQQAMEAEPRAWVRRALVAQEVWCHRFLGAMDRAGEAFLLLLRSDPETPYFACIPLGWTPRHPTPQLEAAARQWLTRSEPAAALLGASHLLPTAARAQAASKLVTLAGDPDPRIAALATAQTWRAALTGASAEQIAAWQRMAEQMPAELLAGPRLVIGFGQAQQKQWESAALGFLHPPILFPDERDLAALGLLEAGRALESAGQRADAVRLCRELVLEHAAQSRTAEEARMQLEKLGAGVPAASSTRSPSNVAPPHLVPQLIVTAEATDERFVAGLRARGLLTLADGYCRQLLDLPQLPPERRTTLVIERSRTLAEQALAAAPEARGAMWEEALAAVEGHAARLPDDPRLPLVKLQAALTLIARGELARQEAELLPAAAPQREDARVQLRAAIRVLDDLEVDVGQRLRAAHAAGPHAAGLSAAQLARLLQNVQFERARALRNQAMCYPPTSADRANALTQAVQILGPLANLDRGEPLRLPSRIDLAVCQRLVSEFSTAEALLAAIERDEPPPEVLARCRAERIRLKLGAGDLASAVMLFDQSSENAAPTPELDLARLEVAMNAWKDAPAEQRTVWQQRAEVLLAAIDERYGPVWRRRAEMLFAGYVSGAETGDLAMLVRVAENAYRSGQPAEAVAAFERARQAAIGQGQADKAFELGFTAATIVHEQQQHAAARDRYRELALASSEHPKAGEAHLLAAYHAGELAKDGQAETLARYQGLLEEHLKRWPHGPSADEARRRLGRLLEFRQDYRAAIDAYRTVSPQFPDYLAALESAERCYLAWISQLEEGGQNADGVAAEGSQFFESLLLGPEQRLPEKWGPVERTAALAAARLAMRGARPRYDQAQRTLTLALQGAADAPIEWRAAAETALVCALAGGGRGREAIELLSRVAEGSPSGLMVVLEGLARTAHVARPELRAEIAAVRLRAVEAIQQRQPDLPPAAQRQLARLRAATLADSGRLDEALAAYRALADADPKDIGVQEAYSDLIASKGDRTALEATLRRWLELLKHWPHGSDGWLRAELAVAKVHARLGNAQHAKAILRTVEAQYPLLGGAELKAEYEKLKRKLGG
ncbi:MAG: hypothetical protein ACOY3P_04390 [Planctomycetota bacterium]